MSKDIRSFFTVISKKSGTSSAKTASPQVKKKPKQLVDSDDDDVVEATPEKHRQNKKPQKRQIVKVLSSDSEDDSSKSKAKSPKKSETKQGTSQLQAVSVADVFKSTPIKQSKVEVIPKPEPKLEKTAGKEVKRSKSKKKKQEGTELGIHNDTAFEQTLLDLDADDEIFEKTLDLLDQVEAEASKNEYKKENQQKVNESNASKKSPSKKRNEEKDTSDRKRSRTDSSSDRNTPKKQKIEHADSGIDPGQEAYEKKRYSAMLYQKYLNRSGPKHHGMKELPKGKPDCLKNLCFLRTGVLDSLDSEEFDNLIKQHGGRVVQGVSKKVNYIVVGDDPGPAKLAKAESLNIPNITEDELLDLILKKSGMAPKYCKKDSSNDSEDLGIEVDQEKKVEKKEEKTKMKKEIHTEVKEKDSKAESVIPSTDKPNKTVSSTSFYNKAVASKAPATETKTEVDASILSLTEKYKPKDLKGIIGQQFEGSNAFKLRHWLVNWRKNQNPQVKKSLIKPSPWAKKDDGAYFKCALLSGSPGVGKTTTATLVAQDLGLDIVEFNASDTRSKRLLHEEVAQLLSSKTIAGFATGQSGVSKDRVLLMDEVDGMAGNEDRGGIQELIQLIKNSNVPIVCMCNDRNHPKIRSLVNYCFDLKFSKPKMEQIRGAMMSVCFKEGLKIPPNALAEIINGTGCDVRQTLNHLAILAATDRDKAVTVEDAAREAKASKKDTVMGPWEVCRAVFTESEHRDMSVADKARLFFYDYSIGPLFVQENYLKVQPKGGKNEWLQKAALAADSISVGDLIDSKIRRGNNWALLESQAMFSSVVPGHLMSGHFVGQINFPAWLGKNSKKSKFGRLLGEIQAHSRTSASASKLAVKLDYLIPLRNAILLPLKKGIDGVEKAVQVMKDYNLLREDFDGLIELSQWQRGDNPMGGIDSKVKSAFTRMYNKQVTLLPYAPSLVVKKKAASAESELLGEEEEVEQSDNEDDDDLSKNAMIKVKKPAAKGKKAVEPGTSKKTESKKGKGKKK